MTSQKIPSLRPTGKKIGTLETRWCRREYLEEIAVMSAKRTSEGSKAARAALIVHLTLHEDRTRAKIDR